MKTVKKNPCLCWLFGVSILLSFCPAAALGSLAVTFSDGTFNDTDWQTSMHTTPNGGSFSAFQETTGGNPDEFRKVTMTKNAAPPGPGRSSVFVFHSRNAATFDPSPSQSILSIDFSMDYKNFDALSKTLRFGLAIRQGGNLYGTIHTTSNSNTTWLTEQRLNMPASDFGLITFTDTTKFDLTMNPDFSGTGSNIEFGFYTLVSTSPTSGGSSKTVGYDNWSATVEYVPEPVTLVLLAAGGGAILRTTRRRNRNR